MKLKPKEELIKKPVLILRVKIKGEIYDRVYSIKDIQFVVNLFNDIHGDKMKISIESVKEIENE